MVYVVFAGFAFQRLSKSVNVTPMKRPELHKGSEEFLGIDSGERFKRAIDLRLSGQEKDEGFVKAGQPGEIPASDGIVRDGIGKQFANELGNSFLQFIRVRSIASGRWPVGDDVAMQPVSDFVDENDPGQVFRVHADFFRDNGNDIREQDDSVFVRNIQSERGSASFPRTNDPIYQGTGRLRMVFVRRIQETGSGFFVAFLSGKIVQLPEQPHGGFQLIWSPIVPIETRGSVVAFAQGKTGNPHLRQKTRYFVFGTIDQ